MRATVSSAASPTRMQCERSSSTSNGSGRAQPRSGSRSHRLPLSDSTRSAGSSAPRHSSAAQSSSCRSSSLASRPAPGAAAAALGTCSASRAAARRASACRDNEASARRVSMQVRTALSVTCSIASTSLENRPTIQTTQEGARTAAARQRCPQRFAHVDPPAAAGPTCTARPTMRRRGAQLSSSLLCVLAPPAWLLLPLLCCSALLLLLLPPPDRQRQDSDSRRRLGDSPVRRLAVS